MTKILVAVRGNQTSVDPKYRELISDSSPNKYGLLEIHDGSVQSRRTYRATERDDLESELLNAVSKFDGVFVDVRTHDDILPLNTTDFLPCDLSVYTTQKEDSELQVLHNMSTSLYRSMNRGGFRGFRGFASSLIQGLKFSSNTRDTPGFVEKREGLRHNDGLFVEFTTHESKTPEWDARFKRIQDGIDAARDAIHVGASRESVEMAFRGKLDSSKDIVVDNASGIISSGYDFDTKSSWKKIEPHAWYTLGACVKGTESDDVAVVLKETIGTDANDVTMGA